MAKWDIGRHGVVSTSMAILSLCLSVLPFISPLIATDRHNNFSESFLPEIVSAISMSFLHLSLILIEHWHQSNFLFHKADKNSKIGTKMTIRTQRNSSQTSRKNAHFGNHRIIWMNFLQRIYSFSFWFFFFSPNFLHCHCVYSPHRP